MSSLHFQNNNKAKKNGGKGFYIALGVCLIAIGVASWTTYDSVVKFANPEESSSSEAAEPTQNTVSGVTAAITPPESSSKPEVKEESSSASSEEPKETSSSKPEEAASKPAEPSQQEEKPAAPAKDTVYTYPVSSSVTKNFSGDNPIFSETMQDWRAHRGADLSAKTGDAVTAIAAGKVVDAYRDDLLGNTLVIEHEGGVTAYYCGLGDTLLVKKDAAVEAGQKIGSVNTVPCECAERPHLHLELKKDGNYIDPVSILQEK